MSGAHHTVHPKDDLGEYAHTHSPPTLSITPSIPASAYAALLSAVIGEVLAVAWVFLRIIARKTRGLKFKMNDFFIFWALFWFTVLVINSIVGVQYGVVGHHMNDVKHIAPERIMPTMMTFIIGPICWALSNAGIKLSIIDFYIKLFGTSKSFRMISYLMMGLVAAYCVMSILTTCLICQPFEYHWDRSIPGGSCGDIHIAFIAPGIVNLLLEFFIILLPMPMLWNLQMSKDKKIGLTVMFSFGAIIFGISIWRLTILDSLPIIDVFYEMGWLSTSTTLETLLGIFVACLPTNKVVLEALRDRILEKSGVKLSGGSRASMGAEILPLSRPTSMRYPHRGSSIRYPHKVECRFSKVESLEDRLYPFPESRDGSVDVKPGQGSLGGSTITEETGKTSSI